MYDYWPRDNRMSYYYIYNYNCKAGCNNYNVYQLVVRNFDETFNNDKNRVKAIIFSDSKNQ